MSTLRVSTLALLASSPLACKPAPASIQPSPASPSIPPATAELEPTAKPRDAATWALLEPHASETIHAVANRHGALRFSADGPAVVPGDGSVAWETWPVVETTPDRVRMVIGGNGSWLSLLVWVDVADLAPQLQRTTTLDATATPRPKAGDGTLELAQGEPIEILERKDTRAHVRTRDERFTGWIDAAALGPTYTTVPFALPPLDSLLAGSTAIAVRPNGPALHTLEPLESGRWEAHLLQPAKRGWAEVEHVEFCHATVRVRGWVRAKSVEPMPPETGGGYGCGTAGGVVPPRWGELEQAPVVELPIDTALLTPDGELVGRTHAVVKLRRAPDGLLRVPTLWGLVPVRAE